jgi:hypothetical protein
MQSINAHLISASGYQDHTTSPSASASPVLRRYSVHRIPHPTFVTIAIRPSYRARDAQISKGDLPDVTSEAPATRWHDGQISRTGEKRVKDFVIQATAKQLLLPSSLRGVKRRSNPEFFLL